jgi:putative hydrolase of the HAD superfamily
MIEYLLFDLDNTLYSADYGLENNVGRRIADFVSAYLDLPREEALRQRQEQIAQYGTTVEWLMGEKGFTDIESYYAAIHPADEADSLQWDARLRPFLESLEAPRAIFTNSPIEHAERILAKLAVSDLFTHVVDIRWSRFKGKPAAETFYRVLDALNTKPETTLFIDDIPHCVQGYRSIGGKGLLLDETGAHSDYPHPRIRTLRELTAFL